MPTYQVCPEGRAAGTHKPKVNVTWSYKMGDGGAAHKSVKDQTSIPQLVWNRNPRTRVTVDKAGNRLVPALRP